MTVVASPDAPGPFQPPNAVAQTGAPDAPGTLSLYPASHTDTTVTYEAYWSTADGADSYEWWAESDSGNWNANTSGSPGSTTSTRVQFTADRQTGSTDDPSTFHVRAKNSDGTSSEATYTFEVTAQDNTGDKPPMPSSLSLSVTNVDSETARVDADWSGVDGAGQYEWTTGYDSGENVQGGITEPDVTTDSETMPRSGEDEPCYFCVNATNTWGDGESNCKPYTVDAQSTSSAPTAPSNLTATGGDSYVELSWDDNSTNESGFKVYRSTTQGFTPGSGNLLHTTGADVTSYTDSTASNGTTYYYRVKATNSEGDSAATSEVSATPQSSGASPDPAVTFRPDDYSDTNDLLTRSGDGLTNFAVDNCNSGSCIELVSEGVPALGTSKSAKYNHGDGEKRFGMTLDHPNVWEVWYEAWIKFDVDFKTDWDKSPPAADFKFIFGLIEGQNNDDLGGNRRWSFRMGHFGCYYDLAAPGSDATVESDCNSYEEWDSEWHRWRLHMKHESSDQAGDGVFEGWIANESGGRNLHLRAEGVTNRADAGQIKAAGIGRNINQLPDEVTPIWWGSFDVYTEDPGW